MKGRSIIVMGVSGSGKSTIGLKIAQQLGVKFIDGDDLHPKANILKMAASQPLNDADREPWLERIRDACFSIEQKNETGVIVCSALRKDYRDQIRDGNKAITFIYLDGSFDLILTRMKARAGHFFSGDDMLRSQFNTLELPLQDEDDVLSIPINGTIDDIVTLSIEALNQD
ncbi:gluconokinase [Moritella sp. F3]|uniref:gluconokinase n=1 Tax=Moritella sp. F3 TaxID=2718882 RepID=UPI0018E0F9D8|nr:gluconokinase [Moritella sp. F3]GIC78715.1 gluconokinase [Moritella sp. F1]GIC82683.1 gluconokinase [Moritella sp. F3]